MPKGRESIRQIKVSVAVMTYEHAEFIKECLDSVLSQKTTFDYEIVVSDDCSSDSTQSILKEYKEKYPDKIHLILRDKNVGGRENMVGLIQACKGEYIAYLDGDDYWYPDKLQVAVSYLDENSECSMVHHDMKRVDEKGQELSPTCENSRVPAQGDINSLLWTFNGVIHSSNVFRRKIISKEDLVFPIPRVTDWLFNLRKAQYGRIGYLPEVYGAYRVHKNSVMRASSIEVMNEAYLQILEIASGMIGVKDLAIRGARARMKLQHANSLLSAGKRKQSFFEFVCSFLIMPRFDRISIRLYKKYIFCFFSLK